MKRVAIVQSNYIPWKGYFDLIDKVDEFVIYDTVQYTRRDWRNRNKIKSANGELWLTIPVEVKGKYEQKIKDTLIADKKWSRKHWSSIQSSYARAKYFGEYKDVFEELYLELAPALDYLSEVNLLFIKRICELLDIRTEISIASEHVGDGLDKTARLVEICRAASADLYLSGPAAKDYIEIDKFRSCSIEVEWMDYAGYPEYEQLHGEYVSSLSILDLLFNVGSKSRQYMLASSY